MIKNYFYDEQIRTYLLQFCQIFVGLTVETGKGADGTSMQIQVPINVGSRDRVVAGIMDGNTHNRTFTLPQMSAWITGIELAPERRKGIGVIDSRVYAPEGGVFPDDLTVIKRAMPIPYNLTVELSIYASNTLQLHQMLEQILMLFDPILQIQKNDSDMDWTKITYVELQGINNEENYPMGTEKRMLVWSLSFLIPIYITAPLDIKNEVVHKVISRIGSMDGFDINEYDENGELQPFKTTFYGLNVSERKI
jgi:hypothetical protein